MWRIMVEAEADDPGLMREVLGAIDTWQQSCDRVSVETYEDGPRIGSRKIIRKTSGFSHRLEAVFTDRPDNDESASG